ncbi:MAG: hypothetical protein AAF721_30225, partial [Myxococcota bacterium]
MQQLTWSVRQRAHSGDEQADKGFDELVDACRDLCRRHFPEEHGYETTRFELSGPLQGTRFEVRRGRLRVLLSAQRFERAHAASTGARRPVEIRVVSSMGIVAPDPPERALSQWAVAACAMGTLGVCAFALGSAGLVSTWAQAALVIPALLAWRTAAAVGISRRMQRQAALGEAHARLHRASLAEALPRWRRLAPALGQVKVWA